MIVSQQTSAIITAADSTPAGQSLRLTTVSIGVQLLQSVTVGSIIQSAAAAVMSLQKLLRPADVSL
jgi:hypothetical protein